MFHLAVTSCLLLVVLTRSLHIVGVSRLGNNVSQFAEELSSTGVIYSPRQLVVFNLAIGNQANGCRLANCRFSLVTISQ